MYYLIYALSLLLFVSLIAVVHFRFPKHEKIIVERILPIALVVVWLVRIICYDTKMFDFDNYYSMTNKPLNNFLGISSTLLIWFDATAVIMLFMRPFFSIKRIKNMTCWIALPIVLLCSLNLKNILIMLQGSDSMYVTVTNYIFQTPTTIVSALYFVLPFEFALSSSIGGFYFFKDAKESIKQINWREIMAMVGVFLLLNIATMPTYIPQFFIGTKYRIHAQILNLTFEHRIFIYFATIIVPSLIYAGLRNKEQSVIRYALIFISVGMMASFMGHYNYDRILTPWRWPIHLCNTAMFLMPICFVFRTKKLFYFTYFINVLGAFLAILMPDYAKETNFLASYIIHYWMNHEIAFFMPILGVALGEFQRPKMKQFYYSMAWFLGYFILVIFLNVYYTAIGHKTDFFFLNSDFIVKKFGQWAKDIYAIKLVVNVGGVELLFRPIYQVLFFIVYIGAGFGTWFVYELFFNIADSHHDLARRLKKIRVDRLAIEAMKGKEKELIMDDKDIVARYELKHFSKRYGNNKKYAVKDANLLVEAGQIFGFLGPNGAGKSTIIKSTVGIQPITEGNIEICRFDCKSQPIQAKRLIGFVPDHYALYEKLTGREYLNYIADIYGVSKEDRDERLEKYISNFNLQDTINSKMKTYSHGMKQKVTIIAALIHNPKIWILDEPLTGLDPESIYQVKKCMIQHAKEGNIVFFSSHIIDVVENLCNKIAIIKNGTILDVADVAKIKENYPSLEDYYMEKTGEKKIPSSINRGVKDELA